jgi:hypothetical protein
MFRISWGTNMFLTKNFLKSIVSEKIAYYRMTVYTDGGHIGGHFEKKLTTSRSCDQARF